MPGVVRLGDLCSGHGCYSSRVNNSSSTNVYVNSIGAHRVTDTWIVHCCEGVCHDGVTIEGSPNVYVNSLPVARIGDSIDCGSTCLEGSTDVICN